MSEQEQNFMQPFTVLDLFLNKVHNCELPEDVERVITTTPGIVQVTNEVTGKSCRVEFFSEIPQDFFKM